MSVIRRGQKTPLKTPLFCPIFGYFLISYVIDYQQYNFLLFRKLQKHPKKCNSSYNAALFYLCNMPKSNFTRTKLKSTVKTRISNHQGRRHYDPRYNTRQWQKFRLQILSDNPICIQCQKDYAHEVDHITPVRLGGEFFNLDNLQALCKSCHAKKSRSERGK